MNDTLIQFQTAKLAKEKGFDVPCEWFSSDNVVVHRDSEPVNHNSERNFISRASQSILQKWLREKHDIHVNPFHQFLPSGKHKYGVKINNEAIDSFETYELALEAGLLSALNLIQK